MMMRLLGGVVLLLFIMASKTSSDLYPDDYFRSPVQHGLRLSGTFGELRSNHFHSGIDIKSSRGVSGDAIVAAADGYISRIQENAGGYGKALYISHPNGFTTVYAHLNSYTSAISDYVKSEQYARQTFAMNLFPEPGQFVVKKGEKIGVLGNTGSSGGPHLHFEIRDTETEEPINPLLFGLKVADSRAPRLHQVRVYELNDKRETLNATTFDLISTKQGYTVPGKVIPVNSDRVGVALKAYDHMNGVTNWNGVYSITLYQEDSLMYQFRADRFAFDQTRYMNAHIDYEDKVARNSYFNRCYKLPGNELKSVYDQVINNGVIELQPNQSVRVTIEGKDVEGNKSRAQFWLRRTTSTVRVNKRYNYLLPYDDESAIDNGQLYLYFPEGSLYENLYLNYQMTYENSENIHAPVHHIGDFKTPVHKYFDIAIKPIALPKALKNKAFVAHCSDEKTITNLGSKWKYERIWGKSNMLGDYCIMVDTIAPKIELLSFKSDMRNRNLISFRIKDNFATDGLAESPQFRATVDGVWILMEHDAKSSQIFHRFDDSIGEGQHLLRLEVTDALGNQSVFESPFIR